MKELLFGWITKGQYELSFLDSIIAYIEIFLLVFFILYILITISEFKEKIEKRRNKWKKQ